MARRLILDTSVLVRWERSATEVREVMTAEDDIAVAANARLHELPGVECIVVD